MFNVHVMDHKMTDMWQKALLPKDATLKDAINNLDLSGLQIAIITNKDKTFLGTLTDGDIRRGLLRNLNLNDSIEPIISKNSIIAPPGLSREHALQLMRTNQVHHLPIVDKDKLVVGLHHLDQLLIAEKKNTFVFVMAGGKGSRLKPYTEECPKPLLLIDGKPMLEHIIEKAKKNGLYNFVFAINYLGQMLENYFADGKNWGVNIQYIKEQLPLGTVGALSLLDFVPDKPFIVINCDILTDINYTELLDFHNKHHSCATMAVRLYEWSNPFGVVMTKGVDIIGFDEKPVVRNHVNAGIYVLEPKVLSFLQKEKYCDMPTLFARIKESGLRTIVYPMYESWLDVGRIEDLKKAQTSVK